MLAVIMLSPRPRALSEPVMRIKVVLMPTRLSEDGIDLSRFQPGFDYEVGSSTAALFLAEGWAIPLDQPEPRAAALPFTLRVAEPAAQPGEPPALAVSGTVELSKPVTGRDRSEQ